MARHKDVNWDTDGLSWESHVIVAVLMDIRDELKIFNRVLRCPNFQLIPNILRGIRRNTARRSEVGRPLYGKRRGTK